jgi:hypothetical protein
MDAALADSHGGIHFLPVGYSATACNRDEKRRFATEPEAQLYALRRWEHEVAPSALCVYWCERHLAWHIGNARGDSSQWDLLQL